MMPCYSKPWTVVGIIARKALIEKKHDAAVIGKGRHVENRPKVTHRSHAA